MTPHGPRPISTQGQVSVPKEVLVAVGLTPGSSAVFVLENDAPPGTILLVPEDMAAGWFASGRARAGEARRLRGQTARRNIKSRKV
jgi:bifunctional DNA-binding transcriptional regulator/antitoxin component of YhaV-PrlF toxin-antitoxin module